MTITQDITETAAVPVVSVNGAEISPAAIAAECQNHPADSPGVARDAAIQALVVRELLLQEAALLGLAAEPVTDAKGRVETTEDALIRILLDQQVVTPQADDDACRRYYDNNQARFRSPDIFEAAHILLSAHPDDTASYTGAVREAEAIIAALTARPQDFGGIARRRSDCPSGKAGGRLGQITRGQTTPEFETFLLALEAGQLCPQPVKTPYGVHVLRLDEKVAGRVLPFEMVRERIADYIEEVSWRRAVSQYIRILAGRTTIDGYAFGATDGPLVQ